MIQANDLFSLKGKTALLTGATGHLGSAMARALVSAGAVVYINSRSREKADRLVSELTSCGGTAIAAVFDVTDTEAVKYFFKGMGNIPLDILINNAYYGPGGTIETSDTQDYIKSYEVTVIAAQHIFQSSLSNLRLAVKQSGYASVINIGSIYGIVSPDNNVYASPNVSNPPFYGAAKAALLQWSRYAACEFGHEGIRVNSISPGPFPADQVKQSSPDFVLKLAQKVPLGRTGKAEEIGGPVVFLASPSAQFVNGINLIVDGGWTAW